MFVYEDEIVKQLEYILLGQMTIIYHDAKMFANLFMKFKNLVLFGLH
jgi:hypothetical protein